MIGARIDGWPVLTITRHDVPNAQMRDVCGKGLVFSGPVACSVIDLPALTCNMYFSKDFPPTPGTVEHERAHCAGYEHPGSTQQLDYLNAWRGRG